MKKKYETIGWQQQELVKNSGIYEKESQKKALKEGEKPCVMLAVLNAVYASGPRGMTRREIAEHLGLDQCCITRAVLSFITDGQFVSLPTRRKSKSGKGKCGTVVVDVRHEAMSEVYSHAL